MDVRARVQGATAPATVEYAARQVDGPWQTAGSVAVKPGADGSGETPLPLRLPGRGLYDLTLTARCAPQSATARTSVAVVFAPRTPDPRSPWGVFYIPSPDRQNPEAPAQVARSIRLLGASWARYNFWAHTYGAVTVKEGDDPTVTADLSQARKEVAALRREGISILGEVAQIPRPLSSRPDSTEQTGDAGPLWCRVKPRDYRLWGQLMEQMAAAFREEIQVWEILNEPDLPNTYWAGTPAEFAEFVEQTARALRRGNPRARIAAAGFTPQRFTGGKERARLVDEVLGLGMAKHLDLFTVHYTDERPQVVENWRALLAGAGASLPIWNTEERSAVPVRWLSSGSGPFFKFLHIQFTDAYDHYGPMVRKDLTPLPAGVEFSVGAHLIGAKPFNGLGTKDAPGFATYRFRQGAETVAVVTRTGAAAGAQTVRLFDEPSRLVLAVQPAGGKEVPAAIDRLGGSLPLRIREGRAEVPYAPFLFVTGCREVSVVESLRGPGARKAIVAEAEDGRFSPGWGVSSHAGFSGGKTVDIWSEADPVDPAGYWVEVNVALQAAGDYEVLFSGNSLSRLRPRRSLSPFTWRFDGGPEQPLPEKIPVLPDVEGAPEGLSVLGTVPLSAGEHTFRLRLAGRRQEPDQRWALWFDAIALRPTGAPHP